MGSYFIVCTVTSFDQLYYWNKNSDGFLAELDNLNYIVTYFVFHLFYYLLLLQMFVQTYTSTEVNIIIFFCSASFCILISVRDSISVGWAQQICIHILFSNSVKMSFIQVNSKIIVYILHIFIDFIFLWFMLHLFQHAYYYYCCCCIYSCFIYIIS